MEVLQYPRVLYVFSVYVGVRFEAPRSNMLKTYHRGLENTVDAINVAFTQARYSRTSALGTWQTDRDHRPLVVPSK